MSTTRSPIAPLLVLAAVCVAALVGCDALGGNDGSGDDSPQDGSIPALWNGTYEGPGQEVDYFPTGAGESDVQVTLRVALDGPQSLERLRLSWNNGDNFAQTSGEVTTLSRDRLVTPLDSVQTDSIDVRFQFRLVRDTVAADSAASSSESVRIRGTLRQLYEGAAVDSTLVTFTATPSDM